MARVWGGMEIGLAWCGGASARGFKVRVLRWRSGVAGALLRRWGCGSSGWLRGWCCGSSAVEQSEISEHSEHSEGLADARSFSRCGRCVSGAGLMAAICLPGEVRRPVPGCYLPGGALGVLSVGAVAMKQENKPKSNGCFKLITFLIITTAS